jgi:hypothetical protein
MDHSPSLRALVASLLWSENDYSDETGGEPLDSNYDIDDIDSDSLKKLEARYQAFAEKAEQQLAAKFGDDYSSIEDFYIGSGGSDYQTEHDYIMTVNGHGCGFWERHDWQDGAREILETLASNESEIHAEVGDDGKIYLMLS